MGDISLAVVGEGPTGLLAIAKLLHNYKQKPADHKVSITWFISRPTYIRRHVVNISKKFLEEIESILYQCERCISGDAHENGEGNLSMSIRTLEYVMYNHIDRNIDTTFKKNTMHLSIERAGKLEDPALIHKFQHVFFCDGANSKGRAGILFNSPYTPVTYIYDEPILILYSGLGPLSINKSWTPRNNMKSKKLFITNTILKEYDLTTQLVYDLISILYNIRKNFSIGGSYRDLWGTGYETYDELMNVNKETAQYLIENLLPDIPALVNHLRSVGSFISKSQIELLEVWKKDARLVYSYLERIFTVIHNNIKSKENIIFNPVLPKITGYGITLDEASPNLRYAIQKESTNCYLLGDSANAFPPGYSMEISMQSCSVVMDVFYSTFCLSEKAEFPSIEIGEKDCVSKNTYEHGVFIGGFPSGREENSAPKHLADIEDTIKKTYFGNPIEGEDLFIRAYNTYQFSLFMNYSKCILCKGSYQKGGRRKTYKKKRQNLRSKNKPYITLE